MHQVSSNHKHWQILRSMDIFQLTLLLFYCFKLYFRSVKRFLIRTFYHCLHCELMDHKNHLTVLGILQQQKIGLKDTSFQNYNQTMGAKLLSSGTSFQQRKMCYSGTSLGRTHPDKDFTIILYFSSLSLLKVISIKQSFP